MFFVMHGTTYQVTFGRKYKAVFLTELVLFSKKKETIQNIECYTSFLLFCTFYVYFCKPAVLKFMITIMNIKYHDNNRYTLPHLDVVKHSTDI